MTVPQQTAPAPKGWAIARGVDGRATLTYDGMAVATVRYDTPVQHASVHALLARLRGAHEGADSSAYRPQP